VRACSPRAPAIGALVLRTPVRGRRAVVAGVADPIRVPVVLTHVRDRRAVVHRGAEAVGVGIVDGIPEARIAGVTDQIGVLVLLAGAALPLLAGFTLAVIEIGIVDAVRFAVFQTWSGLPMLG